MFMSHPGRGGSGAVIIRADDNTRYTVKFKENGQTLRVLVNEFVAAHIAIRLGVPTPEPVLVEVDDGFLQANPFLAAKYAAPVSSGVHFGSRIVRNLYD